MVRSKDGTEIAYTKYGEGPALIIVSGALSARALSSRLPLVGKLAEHYTTYIYDRRGRGESGDTKPYSVDREIEDLEALIDHAGGSAYVLGISSGGALSIQAAAMLGAERITKLALYEPPYGQKPEDFAEQKARVNELIKTAVPGDVAAYFLTAVFGMPQEAIDGMKNSPGWPVIKSIDHTLAYDYEVLGDGQIPQQTLSRISVPTLILGGEKSPEFMRVTADRIAELIPHSERTTFKGLAHQIDADIVTPRLIEFFGE